MNDKNYLPTKFFGRVIKIEHIVINKDNLYETSQDTCVYKALFIMKSKIYLSLTEKEEYNVNLFKEKIFIW